MNEGSLYTIAEVGITLAGFSGLVVAFQRRDLRSWSPPDFMNFFFLITNTLLVVLLSLLPIPLLLWGLSEGTIWIVSGLVMAAWFIGGDVAAIHFFLRHRQEFAVRRVPSWYASTQWAQVPVAALMAILLLLGVAEVVIPRGQAPYVLGLIVLLIFAGIQFTYFVLAGRHPGTTPEPARADD